MFSKYLLLGLLGLAPTVAHADEADSAWSASLHGLVEGRAAYTGDAVGWDDRGLGKVRFGAARTGDDRSLGRLEGAGILQVKMGWDWSLNVSATANGQQSNAVDIQEAFLRYKPAPTGDLAIEARVGIFMPPVSLENSGLAWTSPFTLSSSAINAWIGDEVRGLTAEAAVVHRLTISGEPLKLRATVGVFGFDDPAGAFLAWRGWSVHDRVAGVFERHLLSPLPTIQPGGTIPKQAPWVEPFHELDGRPGYYAGLSLEDENRDQIRALYYDNRADTHVFDGNQYAWHTRFVSLGAKATLPEDIEIVTQAMTGRTTMNLRAAPLGAVVDVKFDSAFLLASRAWDKHRVSARVEYFTTRDQDMTPDDNNSEHGHAATLAYIFRPTEQHRLTLEVLRIQSTRPERSFEGLATQQTEVLTQASWRIFF